MTGIVENAKPTDDGLGGIFHIGAVVACPKCGRPVDEWTFEPYYRRIMRAAENGVPIPGTEEKIRVVGGQGPEYTLKPCGDQFYKIRFVMRNDEIIKIIDDAA